MSEETTVLAADEEVVIRNPGKVFFPERGTTKLDLVNYYVAVADGVVRGCLKRPSLMLRFPNGVRGDSFEAKEDSARPHLIQRKGARVSASSLASIGSVVSGITRPVLHL